MKTRRRQGATLGLVAVCVLVIIVVGIGCFFLAKIFGGGREVANATDAGALNIAKNAMKKQDPLGRVAVSLANPQYADFKFCADPINSNEINLMTYNRAVGQALLVAMNAEQETAAGATQANPHASTVLANLNALGLELNQKLNDPKIVSFFNQVSNDTRMWGNNGVNAQNAVVTRYMKHGESTNVYFTGATLAGLQLPANWSSKGTDKKPPPNSTGSYLRGYEAMTIPGVGNIMGVPVFPQQNPHLVALTDFQSQNSNAPSPNVPPNSFSISTSSKEGKTGLMGGAVAAAIIGAVMSNANNGGNANFQFPAAIPGGYIEIENLASGPIPVNADPKDNTTNIFNNELYDGPGVVLGSTSNGAQYFTTDTGAPAAWAAYNTSSSTQPGGIGGSSSTAYTADPNYPPRNANLNPDTHGHPLVVNSKPTIFTTRTPGTVVGGTAALPDLLNLTNAGQTNCLWDAGQLNATGQLNGACNTYLPSFVTAYNGAALSGTTPPGLYSNVDVVKGQLIGAFQSGQQSVRIPNSPLPPSGLGVYNQNGFGISPEPQFSTPLQETGSIDALLNQVTTGPGATCAKTIILNQLTQRCFEIKPDAVPADVQALWTRTIPMGTTMYVYLNTATNKLDIMLAPQKPPTYVAGVKPDGVPNGSPTDCNNQYQLDNIFVNVPKGSTEADLNLHDQPYTRHGNGNLIGEDHANLTLSTGFNNLLARLQFSNTVQGVENFSRPN